MAPHSTAQRSTGQRSAVQCSAVQRSAVQRSTTRGSARQLSSGQRLAAAEASTQAEALTCHLIVCCVLRGLRCLRHVCVGVVGADDQKNGLGRYSASTKDEYYGEWVDGKQHGAGSFVHGETGDRYEGEWQNDMKHGRGKMEFVKQG
jgi:hypothetical protein